MGKQFELLEAARGGDLSTVEKILGHRSKKSGPLASLWRGVGPNCQDVNGCTPLHHAALNGHTEVVSYLLSTGANINCCDQKGNCALHLAAFNGHTRVVETLLAYGPGYQRINAQNKDNETALILAAQYGHWQVVALLLKYFCEPHLRNVRRESALDLAAQYGRIHTVQLLVTSHPLLLCGDNTVPEHSPLHLAAQNGHEHVLTTLLQAGFDVNTRTRLGTALHQAAMFLKENIVHLLLSAGADVYVLNDDGQTALDLIRDHTSQKALQISQLFSDAIQRSQMAKTVKSINFQPNLDITSNRYSGSSLQADRSSSDLNGDESVRRSSGSRSSGYLLMSQMAVAERPPRKPPRKHANTIPGSDPLPGNNPLRKTTSDTHLQTPPPSHNQRRTRLSLNLEPAQTRAQRPPSSPTSYQQPPTPDHPPPSPTTALIGIHEKFKTDIEKRYSYDIDMLLSELEKEEPPVTRVVSHPHIQYENITPSERPTISPRSRWNAASCMYENMSPLYENVPYADAEDITNGTMSADDDNVEEWDQIAGIMASFGAGIARESMFVSDLQAANFLDESSAANGNDVAGSRIAGSGISGSDVGSVGAWLNRLGLPQYEATLVKNGFDDIEFLAGNIMEEADLECVGISQQSHRKMLLASAAALPLLSPAQDSEEHTVSDWLTKLHLTQYLSAFTTAGFLHMHDVINLWDFQLSTVLHIEALGHRKRILASLGGMLNKKHFKFMCWNMRHSNGVNGDFASELAVQNLESGLNAANVDMNLSQALTQGCCNYSAMYFGSAEVVFAEGMSSIKGMMRKFHTRASVSVVLSVSVHVVKLTDTETRKVLVEHATGDIKCACLEDSRLLAYVSEAPATATHNIRSYCHVFAVPSEICASEVCLALSQAFRLEQEQS